MTARTDHDFTALNRLLAEKTGLHFPKGRQAAVAVELEALRAETGIGTTSEILERMQADPALLDRFIGRITIPESYFFRDPAHFDFIRDSVIPMTLKLRPEGHTFRVWSAGCAGGEEAYSLAMLFDEAGFGQRLRLLASDISRGALSRARQGNYSAWSLRGPRAQSIPETFLERHGKRFQVAERFRSAVDFTYLNLADSNYPSGMNGTAELDLILCRNVLIYLRPQAVEHVAKRLYEALAPGGFLIPGPSDPLLNGMAPFEIQLAPGGLIYRKPGHGRRDHKPVQRIDASTPTAVSAADSVPVPIRKKPRRIPKLTPLPVSEEPSSPLHVEKDLYQEALLLMQKGRQDEALEILRKILYLSPELAVVHFTTGLIYKRLGRRRDALRSFRNARDLAKNHSAEERVPLAGEESAQQLAQAAVVQMRAFDIDADPAGDRP